MESSSDTRAPASGETAPRGNTVTPHKGSLWEIVRFAIIAALIVAPIRAYVAKPFIVSGQSMDPSFENGQYLIVDQLHYRFDPPERGDVLIFRYPRDPRKFFIKRLVGLPGETVEIRDGVVTIFNSGHPAGFSLDEPYVAHHSAENLSITLGAHEYFVLGDNRTESSDSRFWGPLEANFIVGRPLIRLWPVGRFEVLPGVSRDSLDTDHSESGK